ncbi:UDP-glucuronic acid decarboxylase family protein [Orrella sp. JC864]|uniref:UDP-glucuronic acid decarboxylase family protein n=1 Tax=Orrella sp. JC864 TaxID=3120298 RepID=UPI00300B9715
MNVSSPFSLRILVAGGAGFLGSHLCERLLWEGHEVTCVDNFHTGSLRNVAHLLDHERFRLLRHDITEPLQVEADRIYNLACPAAPPHYQADPVRTLRTCLLGAINLLELAAKQDARFLQASTSEVYGDPLEHPQRESYWGHVNPVGPRACYDEGKRCAETLVTEHARKYGFQARIARIFNTYGPRMSSQDGRVVSNFIVQALAGQPLTIYGDGTQTRSFCYVDDMIEGLVRLMEVPGELPGPVNLGNPTELTMLEIGALIQELAGSRCALAFRDRPADDPVQRKPDIGRARQYLGWTPAIGVREGLSRTVAYFESQRAVPREPGPPDAQLGVVLAARLPHAPEPESLQYGRG